MVQSRRNLRRTDRIFAAIVWTFTGLLAGFAVSVFSNSGWFVAVGVLFGLFIAWRQDMATSRRHREQDDA